MIPSIIPSTAPTQQAATSSKSLSDFPPSLITNILSFLPFQAEWSACCLTSKSIKAISEKLYPFGEFIAAIRSRQTEAVTDFLKRGITVHLRIKGTKYCPNVHYTPLICAKEYGLSNDTISLIKKHDDRFTEQFLKNKLLSLIYDINPKYSLDGCSFKGEGLDHHSHHGSLLPEMASSLRFFFSKFNESPSWDEDKTKRLLEALEKYPCLTCSEENICEEALQKIKSGELVIFSKSVYNHRHWVTYAGMGEFLAIGNRGLGCGGKSGVVIYKITEEFSTKDIDSLFDESGSPSPEHATFFCHLAQEAQKTGSCSKFSLEAGGLAGIFLLLNEQNTLSIYDASIAEESKDILKKFSQYDLTNKINAIIQNDNTEGYDLFVLSQIWTNYEICPETKENLWGLLINTIKQTAWEEKDTLSIEDLVLRLCQTCFTKGETQKLKEAAKLLPQFSSDSEFDIKKIATLLTDRFTDKYFLKNDKSFLLEALNAMLKNEDLESSSMLVDMIESNTVQKTQMLKLIAEKYAKLGQMERALVEAGKVPGDIPLIKQTVYTEIALQYALQNDEKKTFEILSMIEEMQLSTFELAIQNLTRQLWIKGKNELSLRLVEMKIQNYWKGLSLLDSFLDHAQNVSEEAIVTKAIIKRIQDHEERILTFETKIAETLLKKNNFAQALSIIELICGVSVSASGTELEKDNLERAIALIILTPHLKDKRETAKVLEAASCVAKGDFLRAAQITENLSELAKDWILNKSCSELKELITDYMALGLFL